MKSILNIYKGVGVKSEASLARKARFIFEGAEPVIAQTPGRLQYYRAENEPFLPDDVKWAIRMPSRFAVRKLALVHEQDVQDSIDIFLTSNLKYDYLHGNRDLNLDMTMREAELLYSANDSIKSLAETGELQDLHQRCAAAESAVETGYLKVMDQLDRALQQISETENDVYSSLQGKGLDRLRFHGEASLMDTFSFAGQNIVLENLVIARAAADERGGDLQTETHVLEQLVGARAWIMMSKVHVLEEFTDKVSDEDVSVRNELRDFTENRDALAAAFGGDCSQVDGDAKIFKEQVDQLREGELGQLLHDMNEHQKHFAEREALYANFVSNNTSLDMSNFRQDLLRHLAAGIVVRDHRVRYQKEQFDRFLSSLTYRSLNDKSQSLREFARNYATLIESNTEMSHNMKCPKIEANYDDFAESKIRPLNATIFYYFFSANRQGRTWAQMMLSAARFPNDRMRRAYMRFFA